MVVSSRRHSPSTHESPDTARFEENAREGIIREWDAQKRVGLIEDRADPSRTSRFDRKALSSRHAVAVVGQPCKYFTRGGKVTLVKLQRLRKAASVQEHTAVIPAGTEALGTRRIVETFLGPLEILDEGLDGLMRVRRSNGDVLQVSKNIVEPSPRPVLDDNPNGATEPVSEGQPNIEEKT